ncbi:uncharacterized protein LOC115562409 [Drosophila navojoa]|uniref:uncharacterized protein LOC115562409 n=1 Tax=Drosophila navojoa TaxID=7232 RepID=UPI0011BE93B6|nr:uncharacterized protein LOC115562409 [Drosophila navojoa]
MKFTNAVCENYNKTLIAITECRLRAVNRNVTTYNFNSTLHYPITEVAVEAQFFKKASGYKPWLYKFKFDGCKFLKRAYNPLVVLIFRLFRDYSNLNHPCPYTDASVFKFTNAVCKSMNATLLTINECRLKAINRTRTVYNFFSTLHYPVHDVAVEFQLFKRANGYKPWLYKTKINACQFLQRPYSPMVIIIFKLMKENSNFNHTCPFVGPMFIKDLCIQSDNLPLVFPTGEYLVASKWYSVKKLALIVDLYFSFVEDLIDQ